MPLCEEEEEVEKVEEEVEVEEREEEGREEVGIDTWMTPLGDMD